MSDDACPLNAFIAFVCLMCTPILLLPVVFPAQFAMVNLEGQTSSLETSTELNAQERAQKAIVILEKIQELESQNSSRSYYQKLDLKRIQEAKDRCNAIIAAAKEASAQR